VSSGREEDRPGGGDLGSGALTRGVQDVEARLVARPASSRCTGVLGISHRSSCPRQQDPVEGGHRALEKKEGRNLVRGMRPKMVKKMG
jgi:hypothetical protein